MKEYEGCDEIDYLQLGEMTEEEEDRVEQLLDESEARLMNYRQWILTEEEEEELPF